MDKPSAYVEPLGKGALEKEVDEIRRSDNIEIARSLRQE